MGAEAGCVIGMELTEDEDCVALGHMNKNMRFGILNV